MNKASLKSGGGEKSVQARRRTKKSIGSRLSPDMPSSLARLVTPGLSQYHERPSTVQTALEDEEILPSKQMRCFRIRDEVNVISYLTERLQLLQQQADKKIAKAWVKGICPKKQARFPYQNKHRFIETGLDPEIPEWWPINDCLYKEPDHVTKAERIALCLHLLRLRPTVQQLRSWNPEFEDRDRILETRGWTAFLKTFTPPEILKGIDPSPEPEVKYEFRRKIMEAMYHVAEKEEAFERGECDDDVIMWEEEEGSTKFLKRRQVGTKRTQQTSTESSDAQGSTTSESSACSSPKRVKEDPDLVLHAWNPGQRSKANEYELIRSASLCDAAAVDQVRTISTAGSQEHTLPGSGHSTAYSGSPVHRTDLHGIQAWNGFRGTDVPFAADLQIPHPLGLTPEATTQYPVADYGPDSDTSSPLQSSFGSVHLGHDLAGQTYQLQGAPNTFSAKQDLTFRQPVDSRNNVQVYHVMDILQPRFDTVPNTPVISKASVVHFADTKPAVDFIDATYGMPDFPSSVAMSRYPMSETFAPVTVPSAPFNADDYTPSHFVPGTHCPLGTQFQQYQPSYYDCRRSEYEDMPHGLPTLYYPRYQIPHVDGPPPLFPYPDVKPEADFPAAPLPGRIVRGFTGHGSGVGGGAMV